MLLVAPYICQSERLMFLFKNCPQFKKKKKKKKKNLYSNHCSLIRYPFSQTLGEKIFIVA